ncbi:MAG: hypothetical protein M0P95_15390 [Sulfuritalea sp.]|jgi:hypothetical protein|nr:hypothetical protein [Sulfuritalea sp.]
MNQIPPAQLLAEIEDVLRTMPPGHTFGDDTPDHFAWLGRALAVMNSWNPIKGTVLFEGHIAKMNSRMSQDVEAGVKGVLTMLHQARHDLRLQTVGPLSVSLENGAVFDYFDEVRKAIESAKADLFFIDPYLEAEFVSRYLPHVGQGVAVRLLARERMPSLLSAVALLRQQNGGAIEVRSAAGFHDRYVIVDRVACYHSGASFKDGAKKAPTTLTQIVDAFPAVLSTYEALWTNAALHP